jgi:hypothetical protein
LLPRIKVKDLYASNFIDILLLNFMNASRFFSSRPHLAGSTRQKELAEYLAKQWKKYGLDVEMPEYKVLLSEPQPSKPNVITIENNGSIEYTIEGKIRVNIQLQCRNSTI